MREIYAQGDVLLERVSDVDPKPCNLVPVDPDGAVVVGRGEVTGHRHAFFGGAVMFRDDGLARDVAPELYVGHVKIASTGAELRHEEHGTIPLPPGTYRVRRQREFEDLKRRPRLVAD